MSEGCSACACGVPGACERLVPPGFLWPGIIVLVITLVLLLFLNRKKLIRLDYKLLLGLWLSLVIVFAGLVYINTKPVAYYTKKAAEQCRHIFNCEF